MQRVILTITTLTERRQLAEKVQRLILIAWLGTVLALLLCIVQ
nr:MAG TPA: hypothetical protein [Caudoviricetes sp.]